MLVQRPEGDTDILMTEGALQRTPVPMGRFLDCYVSAWEPTPCELARLNRGEKVEVWLRGRGAGKPSALHVGVTDDQDEEAPMPTAVDLDAVLARKAP